MMASFVLIILIIATIVTGNGFSNIDDAEVDRLLKKLNKPALKSIKSPDGDIIDCVHMKNHPIYDHPLFKNHTIQMRPSSFPKEWNNESLNTQNKSNVMTQLWRTIGRCPKNSIPIIRTRREDILQAKSIRTYGKKEPNSFPQPKPDNKPRTNRTHSYSILVTKGRFHGAKATISLWKPYVQTLREFSLAQIWLASGTSRDTNTIEAGWQVYKSLYGDYNPRYFIYWTADGYQDTGCYNLKCPGFVHVSQDFAIGATVSPVSSVGGAQYQIPTSIWRDTRSGHWWLKVYDNIFVGYWPSSLFTTLKDVATDVHWGGEITNNRDGSQHTTTKMGSGHFAEEGYEKASYFKNIEIVDEGEIMKPPVGTSPFMSEETCYNIKPGTDVHWGTYFFFGGPGRNAKCK
ncbi:uncharacterized protein LOC103866790 [Brassica rapa]|uniref:uncharacterized protein LOC103866790 n=1 Tax=Brassica campestris TaxID=3711 RepID=UPI0004F155AF|nr:uncharacterized protein LOC103866790 [Brassica rapa]